LAVIIIGVSMFIYEDNERSKQLKESIVKKPIAIAQEDSYIDDKGEHWVKAKFIYGERQTFEIGGKVYEIFTTEKMEDILFIRDGKVVGRIKK